MPWSCRFCASPHSRREDLLERLIPSDWCPRRRTKLPPDRWNGLSFLPLLNGKQVPKHVWSRPEIVIITILGIQAFNLMFIVMMMWTSGWTIISPLCRYTVHEAPSIAKEVGWGQEWLAQNTEQCRKVQPSFRPFHSAGVCFPSLAQARSPKQIALDSLASKPESRVAQQEVQSSNNCRRLQHTDSSGAQNWTAKFQGSPNLEFEFSIV